jgi:pilus assembly protein CpaB
VQRLPFWTWLAMALVCGTVAAIMALGWLKDLSQQTCRDDANLLPMVVAAQEIPALTVLNREQLAMRQFPRDSRPQGSFAQLEEVKGRVSLYPLAAGEPILAAKLAPPGAVPGLPALVSADKRAMTVKVDEASGVGGFLSPESRVDVVVTFSRGDFGKDPIAKVVLQDLKVLGVGQRIENRPGEKPQVVPTVTLEVSPEDGERLALATQEGHIALVLRGLRDQTLVATAGISVNRLVSKGAEKPELAVAPPAARPVEVLRGLERQSVSF